ncbi:MAG TPA: FAD-dependent oxidoreductase [Anaerolineales bacterium]|nr:FAD-dependent oxidoreductase [Anaerolineales bacterium]
MKHYKYLIIGGGMTGDAAVRGIRELDPDGSVGLIGDETDMPYARPPLTKGMWKGRPFERIWRGTDKLNVEFHLGRHAVKLDPSAKQVVDDRGDEYTYDRLLLATGGTPNQLPFGQEHIVYFRTLQDYLHVRQLSDTRQSFLVIGGGFIGSEIAAALAMQGKQVTVVLREKSIGESVYPADLSKYIDDYFRNKGVTLMPSDSATSVERKGERFVVRTDSGHELEVDAVVAGIGIRPNVDLAKSANLQVDNGIVVDDHLRTSAPDVYAAGDVAMFPHPLLGKSVRVEHEDNALMMGKQAGRNMAGTQEAYVHAPYFYSDLFELGYEAIGTLSSKLETVADWEKPYQKGVIYYLDQGRVRGVLLWNVWQKLPDATAVLAEPGPFKPEQLKGRIKG